MQCNTGNYSKDFSLPGLIKSRWFGRNILKILKDSAEVIALPLNNLVDLSIKESLFPDQCKIAKLNSIFKKGSKMHQNYRCISLLLVVCEITEETIQIQIQEYLDKNVLLYKYQSGFCTKFSKDSYLVQLTDFILTGMCKGFHTGVILVDLQKALDQTILLQKNGVY